MAKSKQAAAPAVPQGNLDLLELAVHCRLQGMRWVDIAERLGVGVATLFRWRNTKSWREARERTIAAMPDSIFFLARAVIEKRLLQDLQMEVPDLTTAEKVLQWERELLQPIRLRVRLPTRMK